MKILISLALVMLFLLETIQPILGQTTIGKIEVSDIGEIYYSKDDYIAKKNVSEEHRIFRFSRYSNSKFNDFSRSKNFVLHENHLVTLEAYKYCFDCRYEEYRNKPWNIIAVCQKLENDEEPKKSGSWNPRSITSLNLPNYEELIFYKDDIYFDFFHINNSIMLLIGVGHKMFLYEPNGPVCRNDWKLVNEYRSSSKLKNFVCTASEDTITLYSSENEVYKLSVSEGAIEKSSQGGAKNNILLYDHSTKESTFVGPVITSQVTASDHPLKFLTE